jgi:hypothetical protein
MGALGGDWVPWGFGMTAEAGGVRVTRKNNAPMNALKIRLLKKHF